MIGSFLNSKSLVARCIRHRASRALRVVVLLVRRHQVRVVVVFVVHGERRLVLAQRQELELVVLRRFCDLARDAHDALLGSDCASFASCGIYSRRLREVGGAVHGRHAISHLLGAVCGRAPREPVRRFLGLRVANQFVGSWKSLGRLSVSVSGYTVHHDGMLSMGGAWVMRAGSRCRAARRRDRRPCFRAS